VHGLVDTNAAFPAGFAGNMQDNKFVMIQCTDLEERSRLGLACFQAYKQAAEQPTRTNRPQSCSDLAVQIVVDTPVPAV
jgi:hypothetical protein